MGAYEIKALTSSTWHAFADLCERNNGAGMGGCWCCWFHNATSAERRACGGDDWRDYKERLVRQGRAHAALDGAVTLIAAAGGGVTECYPYDVAGKKVSGTFLHSGTRSMLERAGFSYDRPKGKNHCVMRKVIEPDEDQGREATPARQATTAGRD